MLATEIRALRTEHGWTQRELAARLGTDPVTVSRWERGISRPRRSAHTRLNELLTPLPSDVRSLITVVGVSEAARVLRRPILLAHPASGQQFAANPTQRLRDVERVQREQVELKARLRLDR